jgi:phosphoglycolate phosphatase
MPIYFDLDGTLTDPREGITRCIQHALSMLGRAVPAEDALLWCIGPPLLQSFEKLVGETDAQKAVQLYRERFKDRGWLENRPYDGIEQVLAAFHADDVPLYLATSKPLVFAERILQHFGFSRYFSDLFGPDLHGNPADKAELLSHARLSVGSSRPAFMVGDRRYDIDGGKANGLTTIGVLYGYGSADELSAAGADHLARDPCELGQILGANYGR